ncbi:MAG: hypothetical protein AB9891_04470 [Anaerolineaceae bacterium]
MEPIVRINVDSIESADREVQHQAFHYLLEAANRPVEWSYEVWDEMVAGLASPDNRVRAITAQLLCSLAKNSDPQKKILKDLPQLMAVTKDPRFVTARHTLQAIWKVGAAGEEQKQMLMQALTDRYTSCVGEKNYMLIRYDIIASLKKLYDEIRDEKIRFLALKLIGMEEDPKNHRKNMSLWKNRR